MCKRGTLSDASVAPHRSQLRFGIGRKRRPLRGLARARHLAHQPTTTVRHQLLPAAVTRRAKVTRRPLAAGHVIDPVVEAGAGDVGSVGARLVGDALVAFQIERAAHGEEIVAGRVQLRTRPKSNFSLVFTVSVR